MDEPKPLNHSCLHRRFRSALPILALTVVACISLEPNAVLRISGSEFNELAQIVADRRKLTPTTRLQLEPEAAASDTAPAQTTAREYYGPVSITQLEATYKDIGLLAAHDDFAASWAEYRTLVQQTTLDRTQGTIRLSRAAFQLGAPWEKNHPAAARQFPAVIGVMQAWQEQRFNWSRRISTALFEDRRLSLRAIATGDILLTATRAPNESENRKISAEQLDMMWQIAGEIEKSAARLPDFFRAQAVFPYRHGGEFVSWAYSARGWQGVNGLYANPPLSTTQILHPEKYFIEKENPLRFFPAGLLRRLQNRALIEQSLGEFCSRSLLEVARSPKAAAETAKTWRGDQLFSFQTDNGMAVFWFSTWQDETSARAFLRAYQDVLERRQKVGFEEIRQAKDLTVIAKGRPDRAWLLQSRGPVVLAIAASSADQLTEFVEQAWQDLEIEPEVMLVRFESSRINFR